MPRRESTEQQDGTRPVTRPFGRNLLNALALLLAGHEWQFTPSSRRANPSQQVLRGITEEINRPFSRNCALSL
ncbi:MAG TPA: hypothetical protein VMN36_10195 [Verrucomicrobiales bacterium]|nr:hypothetical protein [Verrucomicrobiales bacterium]